VLLFQPAVLLKNGPQASMRNGFDSVTFNSGHCLTCDKRINDRFLCSKDDSVEDRIDFVIRDESRRRHGGTLVGRLWICCRKRNEDVAGAIPCPSARARKTEGGSRCQPPQLMR